MYRRLKTQFIIAKILIIILFLSISYSFADEENSCNKINFEKNSPTSINEFKVEIFKNKKWTRNSMKILIGNTRVIPAKLKKRFNGQIIIRLNNNEICKFKARIRQNGDLKDHISLNDNNVKQSLDIHLKERNIRGITKFKLFLDGTRGVSDDEIFLTELLRELNFISPRTFYVNATVNGIKSKMLFQEKTEKEMLEYNKKVESAIFEGNERLMLKSTEKFANNNLSNDEIGMLSDIEKSVRVLLGRQTNKKWAEKSLIHSEISLRALSHLNKSYLQFQNSFKNEFNNFIYYHFNFDNENLGRGIEDNIIKLDIYNLILTATNAWHGLSANNRKFYWNKIENYFEPIYYDGNVAILNNKDLRLSLPFSDYIHKSIKKIKKNLDDINLDNFRKKLSKRALYYTDTQIEEKIKIIKKNLSTINNSVTSYDSKLVKLNSQIKFNPEMLEKYFINRKKIDTNVDFIFVKKKKKVDENTVFLNCISPSKCKEISLSFTDQNNLLSGDAINNNVEKIYLGFHSNLDSDLNYKNYSFNQINFYYSDGINFEFDKEKKEFNIYQMKPEARAFFLKSKLKDLIVNFTGYEQFNNVKFLPFDLKGLTGCLSVIDSEVENISFNSQNSNCEDSINFINVKGSINEINIKNAYLDALDLDFSDTYINTININNAGNDCLDVSFGNYIFNNLNVSECNDKGISVGEKSFLDSKITNISDSKIGVASKDSSAANFDKIYLKNLDTCFSAYNKKQEFNGAVIKTNFFQCNNYNTKFKKDSSSKIIIENNVF